MTHADRARIKRQMSIGEYRGENDLSANEFRVATYIHVKDEKYPVTFSHGEVYTSIPRPLDHPRYDRTAARRGDCGAGREGKAGG